MTPRLNRSSLRPRDQDGFTLIELLMSIAILGIIAVPLGDALIGFLHNNDATTARLSESHDAQIAAAYFSQDVATFGVRDYSVAGQRTPPLKSSIQQDVAYDAGPTCGDPSTPTAVVRFLADDYDTSVSPAVLRTDVVAYVVETVNGERQLHRIKCTTSSTPSSDATVVHNLSATGTDDQVVAVLCYATPPPASSIPCDGAGANAPQYVTLTITIHNAKSTDTPYAVTLSGQRRQST